MAAVTISRLPIFLHQLPTLVVVGSWTQLFLSKRYWNQQEIEESSEMEDLGRGNKRVRTRIDGVKRLIRAT